MLFEKINSNLIVKLLLISLMAVAFDGLNSTQNYALAQNTDLEELPCNLDINCNEENPDESSIENNLVPSNPSDDVVSQLDNKEADSEQEELNRELNNRRIRTMIEEEKKKEAQARKDRLNIILPESDINALNGDITGADKLKHENEAIAYEELAIIADSIAEVILKKLPDKSSILIQDHSLIAKSALHHLFKGQLDVLHAAYNQELELIRATKDKTSDDGASAQGLQTALQIPQIATSFVKQIAEFTSLFNQNTTFGEIDLQIEKENFLSQLVAAVNQKGSKDISILDPATNAIDFNEYNNIFASIDKLNQKRIEAISLVSELSVTSGSSNNPFTDRVNTINTAFDAMNTELTTLDATTQKAGIQLISEGATINKISSQADMYLLELIVETEGSYRLRKNIFTGTNLKRSSDVRVEYKLLNAQGQIVAADVISRTSPYLKRDEVIEYNRE